MRCRQTGLSRRRNTATRFEPLGVALLRHENRWWREAARQLRGEAKWSDLLPGERLTLKIMARRFENEARAAEQAKKEASV